MTSRYEVTLGGVKMSSLDKDLLILDVAYSPIEKDERRFQTANLDGYDVANTYASQQTVTVTFELHIYDIAKRNEACQKVNEWAKDGGNLTTNDRKNQFLAVRCTQFAAVDSAKGWTNPMTIVFTTDYIPYWQSVTATALTLTGSKPSGILRMDGNTGDALVTVVATAGASISSFKITVGSTVISLKGISVPTGKQITITYTRNRYLRVVANGASALKYLQPESTDLLLAPSGVNTNVNIAASGKVTTKITARGVWI